MLKSYAKQTIRFIAANFMWFAISCGSSGNGDSNIDIDPYAECGSNWKNEFVYNELQTRYLWYDQVPDNFDHTAFESPQDLLEAAIPDIDRWSGIVPADLYYEARKEGRYQGTGLSLKFDEQHNLWVRFVYDGSPADLAGIRRSDSITSINGRSVSTMQDLRAVKEEIQRNATASFEIRQSDGEVTTETLQPDWITMNTVLHQTVLSNNQTQVGYLVFQTFIEPSVAELDAAFASFEQQGIDDLILDLRYNGGGSLAVAQHLASLITGDATTDEVFQKTLHNDRYQEHDRSSLFTRPAHALGLSRLFVITTEDTCSVSESIINGLRPYIPVIQIGGTTCGKPVGMHPTEFCDLIMLPIHFRLANVNDQTDYFDGLAPTCPAEDDLTLPFGDTEEDSLETALSYITNGICPTQARAANRTPPTETPGHVNERLGIWRDIGAF